jgi:hypothetical protein
MKALGQLAFHEEWRRGFIRKLFGSSVITDDELSTMIFFARVGLTRGPGCRARRWLPLSVPLPMPLSVPR